MLVLAVLGVSCAGSDAQPAAVASSPTQSVAVATPTPGSPSPAPPDIPIPGPNQTFYFGPDMDEATQADVQTWVAYAVHLEEEMLGEQLRDGLAVFVSADLDWLTAKKCEALNNATSQCREAVRNGLRESAAEGGCREPGPYGACSVIVSYGANTWRWGEPWQKQRHMAHEIFHVFQFQIDGLLDDGEVPLDQVRRSGPVWIHEGIPDFVAARVVSGLGLKGYPNLLAEYVERTRRVPGNLEDYLTVEAARAVTWDGYDNEVYSLFMVAIDHLMQLAPDGESSIATYYRSLGEGRSWQESFERAFGLSVDDFYRSFAEVRPV